MVSAYFFAFFQNHLTLYILPHVISGKMIFQENPCPHVLWNMQLAKKYFISGTQSTYRGLGSIDIMAAVRSLIFIGKVRKDPTTRVLIHEKSSLAPPGETMAFKLGDEEGFRWVGAYEISADELLDGKEGKATETKLERGRKLIRELLADKKEISIRELDEKAKEQGISGRTMRDVRSRMKNELEYQVNEKQENSIRLKE